LGGYTGEGAKPLLRAKHFRKISMRLVPKPRLGTNELFTKHFEALLLLALL
jgi:hypothetical protein